LDALPDIDIDYINEKKNALADAMAIGRHRRALDLGAEILFVNPLEKDTLLCMASLCEVSGDTEQALLYAELLRIFYNEAKVLKIKTIVPPPVSLEDIKQKLKKLYD
jgi:hypothetical protein